MINHMVVLSSSSLYKVFLLKISGVAVGRGGPAAPDGNQEGAAKWG